MSKPDNDIGNCGLGCVAEFAAIVQVYLGVCGWVKAAESSACAVKVYLDVITVTVLEGQEGLNSIDAVFVAFAHTVCVPWILHQEIFGVEPGSGIIQVARILTPGWRKNLRVMTNTWKVGLPADQDW